MFSLDRELEQLRDEGVLDDETATRLIALEQRQVVSLYGELRFLMWGGVMLIATGVGIVVSKNLDRIGPLVIALAIAVASLGCYAWCEWRRRQKRESLLDESILLLAALLASAAVAFIEHQWHLLGADWQRHFLFLALLHGVTAYHFSSRTLLSLSISSLAAFFGIERRLEMFFDYTNVAMAVRAFACAAIVFVWRAVDTLVRRRATVAETDVAAGNEAPFTAVFDHFATNLAFWGALILAADSAFYFIGFLIAAVLAALSLRHGLVRREELFVIYAWVYGLIAVNLLVARLLMVSALMFLFAIASITAAIVGLFVIHVRMRGEKAA